MKTSPARLSTLILSATSLLLAGTSSHAATKTWSGGYAPPSGNTPWTNSGNWVNGATDGAPVAGDSLLFVGGTRRTANTNDFADGTSFENITFGSTASSFTLPGNRFTLTGNITNESSANQTISASIILNGTNNTINTVTSGTLTLSGTLTGTTGGFTKTGAGTVIVNKANSFSGPIVIDQGRVTLASSGALGTGNALTMNGGELVFSVASSQTQRFSSLNGSADALITNVYTSSTNRLGTIVVSNTTDNLFSGTIEDGTVNMVVLVKEGSGTLTVDGTIRTYGQTTPALSLTTISEGTLKIGNGGTTGSLYGSLINNSVLAFDRSNSVTYEDSIRGTGQLEQRGSGTLTLTGSHTYTGATLVKAGTLLVNGSIASSSGVDVASGASLQGSGVVSAITGAGTVGGGATPNILTASSVNGSEGLNFAFKITQAAPDYSDATASGNDILRLTGETPFDLAPLTSNNTITVDFSAVTLELGQTYLGGFFTESDTLANFDLANFVYLGAEGFSFTISMIEQQLAGFEGAPVNGYVTQFTVVPEPQTIATLLFGGAVLAMHLRRRKRAA